MQPELIRRAQAGDHRAFIELLRGCDRQIMSIVYRFSGNRYDREDLYQEIFLHCFRSIASFNFKANFKTWLTRLALNRCIDYMQKAPPVVELQESPGNEVDWEQGAKLAAVHAAMSQLGGAQKICFHMYYIEEWTLKEITELLECSEGTVKTHLSRARERVKSHTRVMQWQPNPI